MDLEVLEELFGQSLACLAPPEAPNRILRVSIYETEKKIYIRLNVPVPPDAQAEAAKSCLAEISSKIASYGGKAGMVVSVNDCEMFIVFQRRF